MLDVAGVGREVDAVDVRVDGGVAEGVEAVFIQSVASALVEGLFIGQARWTYVTRWTVGRVYVKATSPAVTERFPGLKEESSVK